MHKLIFVVCLFACAAESRADTYPRQPGIDIIHYVFRLMVEEQPLQKSECVDRRFPSDHGTCGRCPLSWFFDQWLNRPGVPSLKGEWRYDFTRRI